MYDFYNEDYLLEGSKNDDDDDGLLKHGIHKKKENPLYTDYKNEQIMKGKAVKSEKGWKKEEKRKKFIKGAVGVLATGALAGHMYKNHKIKTDPNSSQKYIQQEANKSAFKKNVQLAKRDAKKQAVKQYKRNKRIDDITRDQNYNEVKADAQREAKKRRIATNTGGVTGFFRRHFEEELFNNFTLEELQNYTFYTNESADREAYKQYVEQCKAAHTEPKKYKEWKAGKHSLKKGLIKLAAVGAVAADIHSRKTHDGAGLAERFKHYKQNEVAKKQMRQSSNDASINSKYTKNKLDAAKNNKYLFCEELVNISKQDVFNYLESLDNEDFMRESYRRYCVMMESKGLTPLNEIDFEGIKKSISGYAQSAVNGVKNEHEKREKTKKEKAEAKAKEEAEKLDKMTKEEKIKYLKKKEREQEEKEQDAHDMKQAFRTSLLRGAGEHFGKTAAKIVTKPFN